MKVFEGIFTQKIQPEDGLPRAVCYTCRYKIETSRKRNWKLKSSAVIPTEASLRRIYPLSPLAWSQQDEQTTSNFNEKKGLSNPILKVASKAQVAILGSVKYQKRGIGKNFPWVEYLNSFYQGDICQGMHRCKITYVEKKGKAKHGNFCLLDVGRWP